VIGFLTIPSIVNFQLAGSTCGTTTALSIMKNLSLGVNSVESFSTLRAGSAGGAGYGFKALGSVIPKRSN
jgi:hypothetical protein